MGAGTWFVKSSPASRSFIIAVPVFVIAAAACLMLCVLVDVLFYR